MKNYYSKIKKILLFAFAIYFIFFDFGLSLAADTNSLKDSINQKSQELLDINSKIQETQQKLQETKSGQNTLKKAIDGKNKEINEIQLRIKSGEILIDKLGLEINSTQNDISDIESKIDDQKNAVAETLRELQEKDSESPFIIFLKNKSLSDSVLEAQSLNNLNSNLTSQIKDLNNLRDDLGNKITDLSGKKQVQESESVNLKNRKIIAEDIKKDKQNLLDQSKNQEKVYQKNLTDLEKRQLEIAAEIEGIDEQLRLKIDPTLLPTPRPGLFATPIAGAVVTQGYGSTDFATHGGYRGKWHNGVDFGTPIGTEVLAAESGTVIGVGNQDKYCYRGAYGKYIAIKHENNLTTLYGHLSLQVVKIGDTVKRGQLIGYSGKTGYATGPHLHFTVFSSATFSFQASRMCGPMPVGGDLNPLKYL